MDNLWASFKEDVSSQSSSAAKGKRCPSIGEERPTKTMKVCFVFGFLWFHTGTKFSSVAIFCVAFVSVQEETAKETVTITKSYDFAGEEVRYVWGGSHFGRTHPIMTLYMRKFGCSLGDRRGQHQHLLPDKCHTVVVIAIGQISIF